MKTTRLLDMEQYINEKGTVRMDELCEQFEVSINTVRHDVAELTRKGVVRKVYGGVTSVQNSHLIPFETRRSNAYESKLAIGRFAASLVQDGDVIFLDSGTTTMHMIDFLPPSISVTLLTHNLNAINAAVPAESIEVFSLPGKLDRKTNSFISSDIVKILKRYNITQSFMAASSVSASGAVTNSSLPEYEIKQYIVNSCEHNTLLIDSSKFGRSALMTYARLDQIQLVVTDKAASDGFVELCQAKQVPMERVTF